ncbi:MAG: hypothetical protein ACRYG4_13615, partial [Janthinobacterium lividum]
MTVSGTARRATGLTLLVAGVLAWPSRGQVPDVPSAPATPRAPSSAGPKSLLPDTFGPSRDAIVAAPAPLAIPDDTPDGAAAAGDPSATDAGADAAALAPATGAAIDVTGPLTPALGGYGAATFAGSNGVFVGGLMRRIATPIASRWAHIVLRRALLSQSAAPAGINPADWIAERARLLLAMGEVDGAKDLVDNLPADRFTPRLYRVAGQVHLAAADLPGLCTLSSTGSAVSTDPVWRLAEAMCAGMSGDDISAASGFDALRGSEAVDPFDVMLGERIATISGGAGRAANVEWEAIDRITPYRFGVATAAGVAIPPELLERLAATTHGTSWGWVLRAPNQSAAARAAAVRPAAAIGISSASEMVAAISAGSAELDREALDAGPAGSLRQAYVAGTVADRIAAMKTIWASGTTEPDRYAARIETALAAARLPVDTASADAAPDLIAAMLSAGIDRGAARWWPVVEGGDDAAGSRGWALLAAGAPAPLAVTPGRFRDWMKADAASGGRHRAQLLLAALDGLGRTRGSGWDDLRRDLDL